MVLGQDGEPLKPTTYSKRVRLAMDRALKSGDLQERFHVHDIRASHVTKAEELGLDTQSQLLHTDARTTEIYSRSKRVTKVIPLDPPE